MIARLEAICAALKNGFCNSAIAASINPRKAATSSGRASLDESIGNLLFPAYFFVPDIGMLGNVAREVAGIRRSRDRLSQRLFRAAFASSSAASSMLFSSIHATDAFSP
jgi:hypothetical protein